MALGVRLLACPFLVLAMCFAPARADEAGPAKIIIDTDFATMLDDGQVVAMAAQLRAEGKIDLLGVAVVSGDEWRDQEIAEAVRMTERLGIGESVGVYPGADLPLAHDRAAVAADFAAGAGGDGFIGAWGTKKPRSKADLVPPPDGFAERTEPRRQRAADFIVQSARAHPHEITIVAIGPLTDLALVAREHPDVVGLIKQVVVMGGAFDVPGNTTAKAELNWWFDPVAADEVLKLPVPVVVAPLDLSATTPLTGEVYRRIARPARPTAITDLYREIVGAGLDGKGGFEDDPGYTQPLWDQSALAYAVDPSFATTRRVVWPAVVAKPGASDGAVSYSAAPVPGRRPVTVLTRFDNDRYYSWYVDLMTRPVPPGG
ncbi:MAG: nucleoside hydrolase [Segniliparus sp.]|uniref:nucleoside hydrolase n=1 Tax=Segniliparus sp. TaxID=2804064 RepID=UPI003F3BD21B